MEQKIIQEWTYQGRKCKMVKNTYQSGNSYYCAYVRTPLNVGTDSLSMINVHGGLTYGPDDDGWYGFDCAHSGDKCVDEDGNTMNDPFKPSREWSAEDVKEETERLAEQLNEVIRLAEMLDT